MSGTREVWLYTSQRGLVLKRLADAQMLCEALTREEPMIDLCMPDPLVRTYQAGSRYPPVPFCNQTHEDSVLDKLWNVTGHADETICLDLRKFNLFCFEFMGQVVVAQGDDNTHSCDWMLVPGLLPGLVGDFYAADAPEIAGFWPDFVDTLVEALGQPLSLAEVSECFGEASLPVQRRRARVERQALTHGVSPDLSSNPPRPRL